MDEREQGGAGPEAVRARLESELPRFVGLTPDEARALADELGVALRVLEPGALYTMDLRTDRVTADAEDGRITDARIQ